MAEQAVSDVAEGQADNLLAIRPQLVRLSPVLRAYKAADGAFTFGKFIGFAAAYLGRDLTEVAEYSKRLEGLLADAVRERDVAYTAFMEAARNFCLTGNLGDTGRPN